MILNKSNYLDYDLTNKVIAFPTDTVYGIGCRYNDIDAIKRIYDIKGRDYSKPMVILCANIDEVNKLIKPGQVFPKSLSDLWPGKITIIFFKNEFVYDIITSGKETVGIRIPGNDISLNLLKKHGPMVVTSLNYSNEPAILKFKEALKFEKLVDYIIEGEDLKGSPSTVYDLTTKKVLRQGEIKVSE